MPALLVVAALAALTVAGVALYRLHQLRRALIAERASARIAGRMQARDLDAFRRRVAELMQERAVLAEAERVLDTALATHRPEGGPS
ncbi:hypothetical protein [Streptomyces cylindrosporus]|uniref:Uncharacterized protein n=1 Tax=Streptomyces cylindrosporus TaxID=2927583 RepID=A0ABS9YPI6_9ACTN|nr:hypothetical protein [Streptomyces cylindrosporus]MCI3279188.1 hypothetical protein [Streptomyces cylindrosporus]